jgi:tetratricopeptide (TPR) repeat protein
MSACRRRRRRCPPGESAKGAEARNVQEAKSQLDLAIKANPRSAEAWLMLAGAEIENGETGRAIEHYQRALRLAPDSFSGHYDLALAYLRERKLEEARGELERAVRLNPRQPDAAYNLGMVLLEMGNARDAVRSFHQARSLQPDRPDIAFNLIRADLAAGDWLGAREESRNAAPSFAGDPGWQTSVGRLFVESGHIGHFLYIDDLLFRKFNLGFGQEVEDYQILFGQLIGQPTLLFGVQTPCEG